MVFSTSAFLFLFFPITFIGYYLTPPKGRNTFLFLASLIFYSWGGSKFLLILIGNTLWNYAAALIIGRTRESRFKKWILITALIGNISILVYFKYLHFIADIISGLISRSFNVPEILLPIGISFYTFQAISYVVEVYRGETALKNPIDLGMYITFFPQLIAGPIIRYRMMKPFLSARKTDLAEILNGFERFLIGLCKKVLLANSLGSISDQMIDPIPSGTECVLLLWIKAAAFALQIYYDFSGYSDMAIGLGHMFGFTFPENFHYPYCASGFGEFWKRWHITLSSWFRDYVYIPLGGSRTSGLRHELNLLIVWGLSGLWHGASWNFIIWGLTYFALLSLEKHIVKPERFPCMPIKIVWRVFTMICITCNWIFFKLPSLSQVWNYFKAMMGFTGLPFYDTFALFTLRNNKVLFPAAVIFATPIIPRLQQSRHPVLRTACSIFLLAAVMLAIASILQDAYNPFIYFIF